MALSRPRFDRIEPRLVLTALCCALFALPAGGAIFHVDGAAAPGGNGLSWGTAYRHLQDALNDPALTSGDEIWVARGFYLPDLGTGQTDNDRSSTFALPSKVAIYGGFASGDTFGQRDPETKVTVLYGDLDLDGTPSGNAHHVLSANGSQGALVAGVTISKGNADGAGVDSLGGGVYCLGASDLTFEDCRFEENQADLGGGFYNGAGTPEFIRCHFTGNLAATRGGAVANLDKPAAFANCRFSDNSGGDDAGAVFNRDSESSFANCAFSGNAALLDDGGAILNTRSPITLVNCSFQGNAAGTRGGANPDGGAIFNWDNSHAVLVNCLIWNNAEGGSTSTTSASVSNAGGSSPNYERCLVENLNPSGSNLDGTLAGNDPLFLLPTDPLAAPEPHGRLQLAPGSPAIDVGTGAGVATPELGGHPRSVGAGVDLGAHEHQGILHVDDNAPGSGDGSSWTNAFNTLQEALAAAPGTGKIILVAAGIYFPDLDGTGDSNVPGDTFDIGGSLLVVGSYPNGGGSYASRDPIVHASILSGDIDQDATGSGNSRHVLRADGTTAVSFLDGFTVTGGNASGPAGTSSRGGGMLCTGGASPTLANCRFLANDATTSGAAVHNTASTPCFVNCGFERNSSGERGGAVLNDESPARFMGCLFRSNESGTWGGALRNDRCSPEFTNCRFQGNSTGTYGGAVFNALTGARPTFFNCTFQGNSAGAYGGALCNADGPLPTLVNCSLQGNSAGTEGGAISDLNAAFLLDNSVIWNNAAAGNTTTTSASISSTGAAPSYDSSLIENLNPGGSNLDGNDPGIHPMFLTATHPLAAPQSHGDLRVAPGSSLVDAGISSFNDLPGDLAGNPRIQGASIDIGAFEGTVDPATLWMTDSDGDGLPWGVEHALGSDPESPGPSTFLGPAFNLAGLPNLLIPKNPAALPGTEWVLTRSTDLTGFDEELWRFDGTTNTTAPDVSVIFLASGSHVVTDEDPPVTAGYYRFEAEYRAP